MFNNSMLIYVSGDSPMALSTRLPRSVEKSWCKLIQLSKKQKKKPLVCVVTKGATIGVRKNLSL